MVKERAITGQEKTERRQKIMACAWELFEQMPYEDIFMEDVARLAGLAKGTLYLYFKTKEELFLAVQMDQLGAWFEEIDAHLAKKPRPCGPDTVADLISSSLGQRPALARMFAILHVVLEKNVEIAPALEFKRQLLGRLVKTGAELEACLPFLPPGGGLRLLLQGYALVIGLQHVCAPTPVMRAVIDQAPDLAVLKLDFVRELRDSLSALIIGWEVQSRRTE